MLFNWYRQKNIENIGYEGDEDEYDKNGESTGKGPVGHYELLTIAANVTARLQREGFLAEKFDKAIPTIVHGREYAWYDLEATETANPGGETAAFFEYI